MKDLRDLRNQRPAGGVATGGQAGAALLQGGACWEHRDQRGGVLRDPHEGFHCSLQLTAVPLLFETSPLMTFVSVLERQRELGRMATTRGKMAVSIRLIRVWGSAHDVGTRRLNCPSP